MHAPWWVLGKPLMSRVVGCKVENVVEARNALDICVRRVVIGQFRERRLVGLRDVVFFVADMRLDG